MDIPIILSKRSYFTMYVEVLNPILKLKRREKELLVEYLKLAYKNINYNEQQLKDMFTDQTIKWDIRRTLNMSEPSFNNHIKQLRDKSVFVSGLLNPLINAGLTSVGKFNLNYKLSLKVEESGQTDKETNRENSTGT